MPLVETPVSLRQNPIALPLADLVADRLRALPRNASAALQHAYADILATFPDTRTLYLADLLGYAFRLLGPLAPRDREQLLRCVTPGRNHGHGIGLAAMLNLAEQDWRARDTRAQERAAQISERTDGQIYLDRYLLELPTSAHRRWVRDLRLAHSSSTRTFGIAWTSFISMPRRSGTGVRQVCVARLGEAYRSGADITFSVVYPASGWSHIYSGDDDLDHAARLFSRVIVQNP